MNTTSTAPASTSTQEQNSADRKMFFQLAIGERFTFDPSSHYNPEQAKTDELCNSVWIKTSNEGFKKEGKHTAEYCETPYHNMLPTYCIAQQIEPAKPFRDVPNSYESCAVKQLKGSSRYVATHTSHRRRRTTGKTPEEAARKCFFYRQWRPDQITTRDGWIFVAALSPDEREVEWQKEQEIAATYRRNQALLREIRAEKERNAKATIELSHDNRPYVFKCREVVEGVAVDPILPENFSSTRNESRPARQLAWWDVPYIEIQTDDNPQFVAAWKGNTRYDVRCLDGGAWDRPTCWGMFATLAEAVALAKGGKAVWNRSEAIV